MRRVAKWDACGHILFVGATFFRATLANYYSKSQMNLLKEMGEELKILGPKKISKNNKNELEIDGAIIKYCDYFDIAEIEKNRDQNDGQYHDFEPQEKGENDDEEMSDDVVVE